MALKIVGSLYGFYHARIVDNIYMTSGEAAEAGQAYKLSSGKWTKATGTDRIYAICIKDVAAGAKAVMEIVKPGDIIEADYTGTPHANFGVGCETATLGNSDGSLLDASDVSGGHLIILEQDTTNKKVHCVATKTFLNDDKVGGS
jgi:hypothetical protein